MIYVTGSSGLIGKRFLELFEGPVTKVSYRDNPQNIFLSHENSCLIHLAWSSTTRNTYDQSETYIKNDLINSKKIFDFYSKKNPNGKIIFISTAGALYTNNKKIVNENSPIKSNTLYSDLKLKVEDILNKVDCKTVILRVSNVWGSNKVSLGRINGLVDKLLNSVDTENIIELYANLDTRIDIIHIDDLIDLIQKCIEIDLVNKHEMFVVGSQSLSIKEILQKIVSIGHLNIKLINRESKYYLNIDNKKVSSIFNWTPKYKLI